MKSAAENTARSSGFVLPLVLVATAAFALSALTLLRAVDVDRDRIARLQVEVEFERRALIAQARIAHLALTEPIGANALRIGGDRALRFDAPDDARKVREAVRLDGAWYAVDVDGHILEASVQDEAGLVNLNGRNPVRIQRLLAGEGISADAARRMADRIADYIDDDDLRRPAGAEKREYERDGLASPRNASFTAVEEAAGVLGWREDVGPAEKSVFDLSRVAPPDAPFNVNTAPALVLAAVLGADDRRTREIVRRRATQIVSNTDELAAIAGGGLEINDLTLTAAPARTLRVRVREAQGGARVRQRVFESSLVFAEPGARAPIGIGRRSVGIDANVRSEDDRAAPLPDRRSLLAR